MANQHNVGAYPLCFMLLGRVALSAIGLWFRLEGECEVAFARSFPLGVVPEHISWLALFGVHPPSLEAHTHTHKHPPTYPPPHTRAYSPGKCTKASTNYIYKHANMLTIYKHAS